MNAEEGSVQVKMLVIGHVQGVGFRAAAQRIAKRLNLKGYVRNMPDGSVEICVEGCRETIGRFSESLKTGSFGRIDQIVAADVAPLQPYDTFMVVD